MEKNVEIPRLGESITEATLVRWLKADGDLVRTDDPLCELETDKATVEIPSPTSGKLKRLKEEGAEVKIGESVAVIEEQVQEAPRDEAPKEAAAPPSLEAEQEPKPEGPQPPPPKEEVLAKEKEEKVRPIQETEILKRVPMSRIRKTIAERLVRSQHEAAILTTFNEADMSEVLTIRKRYGKEFEKAHGISLGLMSFFVRAVISALREFPLLNASLEGNDIVYHKAVHMGIAVSTERGLVVPVLKNAEKMSFAQIESEIQRVAQTAREGKLALPELSGGTFTITNGGVFGSLLSTPLLNPPQAGILGMHAIQKRARVLDDDRIEARPMMYLALSYDHRLVDGRESVQFLVSVKNFIEEPVRFLLLDEWFTTSEKVLPLEGANRGTNRAAFRQL